MKYFMHSWRVATLVMIIAMFAPSAQAQILPGSIAGTAAATITSSGIAVSGSLSLSSLTAALSGAPAGSETKGEPQTVDASGNIVRCDTIEEANGGKLMGVIMPCMIKTMQVTTTKFTTEMISAFRPLFYAFLTLVVVLFGLRILKGEPEIHKSGLLLLIKITMVLSILDAIPTFFVPQVYTIMSDSVTIVTGALDGASMHCNVADFKGPKTLPLWAMMDCVTGKMFGFTAGGSGRPNMLLATGLFGMLSGFLFGGAWGVVVFFGLLGVIVSVFMLVIRTALAFVNGYLTICLMLIISPLILPLAFLRITQNYFEPLWKNILAAFLLPVIVSAYAMIALLLYDKMLFEQDSTGRDTSMIGVLFNYDKIQDALKNPRPPCAVQTAGTATPNGGGENNLANVKNFKQSMVNQLNPMLTGVFDPCSKMQVSAFSITDVNDPRFKKEQEAMRGLFVKVVTLIVLGFLINAGQTSVMDIVRMLTGGGVAIGSLSATLKSDFKLEEAASAAKQGMMNAYAERDAKNNVTGYVRGSEFMGRAPKSIKQAIEDFAGSMRK